MHGVGEVLHLIFHIAPGKEEPALNEQHKRTTFTAEVEQCLSPRSAAMAGSLHSQEKSGLRSDLQLPLCTLSRQVKAHTSADSH